MKRLILSVLSLLIIMVVSGCSSHHELKIDKSYVHAKDTKIKVDKVTDITGVEQKLDIKNMLKVAFEKQLKLQNLLANNHANITLDIKILEYSEGNAFKRWLIQGWGATILTIEAKLFDENKKIGYLKATRNIAAGGGYTIGEWKDVFDDLAAQVVEDFKKEFKK